MLGWGERGEELCHGKNRRPVSQATEGEELLLKEAQQHHRLMCEWRDVGQVRPLFTLHDNKR